MKDENRTKEQLIEELKAVRKRQQILSSMRRDVRKMKQKEDIEDVLEVVGEELKRMEISFLEYGIHLVDISDDPPKKLF